MAQSSRDDREQVASNRAQQAVFYGEPLGHLLGRAGEQLGLTQARIAGILGLSAPMLSQLASGHRVKIGNPVAVQRLQALVALGTAVTAGRIPRAEVESRLAEISVQAAVVTQGGTGSGGIPSPSAVTRAVQGLFRAAASAEELLGAAALLDDSYPEIATLLRVYGAGRTADALAHFEAHAHLL